MKKTENELTWFFPSTNHGEEDGFADSLLEYFQGDHEKYLAREAIQNSVDARLNPRKPVSVIFERFDIQSSELPGHAFLGDRMKRCLKFVQGQAKAEEFFKTARILIKSQHLSVLKISDFNTRGLEGGDLDRNGNWYRLVRATGTSSPKGVAGGSFGIGKGAPIAASGLRTVFYSSINDKGEAVFQGKARLVSHYDDSRDVCQRVGFYGVKGYQAVRNLSAIPDLFRRKERGTDIFVMGYTSNISWKEKLIRSVLDNFWLAILHDDLEVIIKDGKEKSINKDNIRECIEEYDAGDAKFYLEAVTNPTKKFEADLKHLGKVELFIRKEEGYPGKIMMARKPKMVVQEKSYRVLREPYAGVFLCADDDGNQLLREMEPPAHDKWDRARADKGWAALGELDAFIKAELKSMGETLSTEPQDIPGLNRYLPESEDREFAMATGQNGFDATDLSQKEETSREIGALKEPDTLPFKNVIKRTVIVKSTKEGTQGNREDIKTTPGKPKPRGEEPGDGSGKRIRTSDISFRSFVKKSAGKVEYTLVLTGKENCSGAISLVAVGDDGVYSVDIISVADADSGKKYSAEGATIKELSIEKGQTVKLNVCLFSNRKYALGVEKYDG